MRKRMFVMELFWIMVAVKVMVMRWRVGFMNVDIYVNEDNGILILLPPLPRKCHSVLTLFDIMCYLLFAHLQCHDYT